jgi:hypothetical protein
VQTLTPEEPRRLMLLDHNLDKMLLKLLALPVQKAVQILTQKALLSLHSLPSSAA